MTPNAVRVALNRARAANKLNDIATVLGSESAALAVESLNSHLKKKNLDATLETLKGLGHFRNYNNSKNEHVGSAGMPALVVNVMAPAVGAVQIATAPVGVPREDV
jgi:hypothetical protein